MILVDTNIPLRIAQIGHAHRQVALDALERLTLRDQERFAIAPQSLYEMYVVCTRPVAVNGGFGMTASQAHAEITAARSVFELLPESAQVYPAWEGLVGKYGIQGKRAHDVRLVALMMQHRVTKILTFNDADFRSMSEVQSLHPCDVVGIARF